MVPLQWLRTLSIKYIQLKITTKNNFKNKYAFAAFVLIVSLVQFTHSLYSRALALLETTSNSNKTHFTNKLKYCQDAFMHFVSLVQFAFAC